MNKKITESFSTLNSDLKKEIQLDSVTDNTMPIFSQFNDFDVRICMMKSLHLDNLPTIDPDSIDESTGLIAKNHPFFKKYDLKEMLKEDRRG